MDFVCLMTKAEESTRLWHSRFGHVNFKAMNLMSTDKMAHGLPVFSRSIEVCEGCIMSKQTRRPFPHQSDFRATQALELIHGDLCGPISPETTSGNKYFLFLVDDFTRKMWIHILKGKSEAFNAFKKLRMLVENKTKKKELKCLEGIEVGNLHPRTLRNIVRRQVLRDTTRLLIVLNRMEW